MSTYEENLTMKSLRSFHGIVSAGEPQGPASLSAEHWRPPPPYQTGWRFTVQEHIPPKPTLVYDNCCVNSETVRAERLQIDPQELCLRNAPLPSQLGRSTLSLEIQKTLQVGNGNRAQVFVVSLSQAPDNQTFPFPFPLPKTGLVAKLFDPLYCDDEDGYCDTFHVMDEAYTHEIFAYHLLSDLRGKEVPRFYGSYSLSIPISENAHESQKVHSDQSCQEVQSGQTLKQAIPSQSSYATQNREVRMILMEFIDGKSMSELQPNFPQQTLQVIMRMIVDLESRMFEKEVLLQDLAPRNVILQGLDQHPADVHVVFVDFGDACQSDNYSRTGMDKFGGQYVSPLLRWRKDSETLENFRELIDWDWDSWLESEFGYTGSTITPEMRSFFESRELINSNK